MKRKIDDYLPLILLLLFCSAVAAGTYFALHFNNEYRRSKEITAPTVNPGALPDRTITPGMVRPGVTKAELCDKNFRTGRVRNVPDSTKEAVRRFYGMTSKRDLWCNTEQGCEIDHLVPLLLGGANDPQNLFPQAYQGLWNAHHKDRLEVRMKRLVCADQVGLVDAQAIFMENWIDGYKKYIGTDPNEARRDTPDETE
jgi:hypothetical protein